MPSWATIALRMKALLFGSSLSSLASSSSTLNATTAALGGLRDIGNPSGSGTGKGVQVILPDLHASAKHLFRRKQAREGSRRRFGKTLSMILGLPRVSECVSPCLLPACLSMVRPLRAGRSRLTRPRVAGEEARHGFA